MDFNLIMENWNKYRSEQKIIEEARKILREQSINPCQSIDFNKLIIQAVQNPKNAEVFDALRKSIFGAHKRSKKDLSKEQGTIEIINESDFSIYDITIEKMGPSWDGVVKNLRPKFTKKYGGNFGPKIGDSKFKFVEPYAEPNERKIEPAYGIRFHAPNAIYQLAYRWYPPRYYTSPGEVNPEYENSSTLQRLSAGSPEEGFKYYIHLNHMVETAQPYYPLEKGVQWILVARSGKQAEGLSADGTTGGAADDPNAIRVPTFSKLYCRK